MFHVERVPVDLCLKIEITPFDHPVIRSQRGDRVYRGQQARTGIHIHCIRRGRLAEHWEEVNLASVLRQLGVSG